MEEEIQKIKERLNKLEKENKKLRKNNENKYQEENSQSKKISRRKFLKKLGAGALGLGALSMPASAAFQKLSTQNWAQSNFNQYTDTQAANAAPIQTVNGQTGNINIDTGSVPSGTIVMWNGGPSSVPSGWTLCDGNNGAPDLRNRFVTGAGDEYSVGDTGGEKEHRLTEAELPSHNHDYTDRYYSNDNDGIQGKYSDDSYDIENKTTGSVGNDEAHENRPRFYAIAYIMKL